MREASPCGCLYDTTGSTDAYSRYMRDENWEWAKGVHHDIIHDKGEIPFGVVDFL
jgi:hypothetical protein